MGKKQTRLRQTQKLGSARKRAGAGNPRCEDREGPSEARHDAAPSAGSTNYAHTKPLTLPGKARRKARLSVASRIVPIWAIFTIDGAGRECAILWMASLRPSPIIESVEVTRDRLKKPGNVAVREPRDRRRNKALARQRCEPGSYRVSPTSVPAEVARPSGLAEHSPNATLRGSFSRSREQVADGGRTK